MLFQFALGRKKILERDAIGQVERRFLMRREERRGEKRGRGEGREEEGSRVKKRGEVIGRGERS